MVNYAVLYGKTPFTLSRDITTQEAAQEFIDAYFAGSAFAHSSIASSKSAPDRRRPDDGWAPAAGAEPDQPQLPDARAGRARGCQHADSGSAADILKKAMIDLHAELPRRGLKTRMILTVHDELLFESPRDEADDAEAVVRDRMENAMALSVPLTVDVGIAGIGETRNRKGRLQE